MKTLERRVARAMRREQGRSIKEIARLVGVAPSTVSAWVRDIELTAEQHAALAANNHRHYRQILARASMARKARDRRLEWQQRGRLLARRGDRTYVAGCMLYWAEGSRSRNDVIFTNSDPEMARFFVTFIRRAFPDASERFRVTCNLFADHEERQREVEDFWLATLGVTRTSLCPSIVNRYSRYTKKRRTNKLPYGTCRIVLHSAAIAQTIYGSIQEIAAFDRPEWLDM